MKSLIRKNNGLLEEKLSKYWLLFLGENKAVDKDLQKTKILYRLYRLFLLNLAIMGKSHELIGSWLYCYIIGWSLSKDLC